MSGSVEFVDSGRSADELIEAIRTAGIPVTLTGRTQHLRRTSLDTFDRRVAKAGFELEQIELGTSTTIELRTAGHPTLRANGAVTLPALADVLPAGPLRERVAAVSGIRALQATARQTARRSTLGVLNADGKTVARVHIDTGRGAAHLTVLPLRGYERQAERVAGQVAAIDGLTPVDPTPAPRADRKSTSLTPDMPAAEGVAAVLGDFLDTFEANVPGVLADIDTEYLHDLRVSVRKARSFVKLTGDVLAGDVARLATELRWLGDVTTPVRDLDVYVLGLPGLAARLRAAAPTDLEPFAAHLAAKRAIAFTRLQTDLRSPRMRRVRNAWRAVLHQPTADGHRTVADLAAERLTRAHRRLVKRGARITDASPAEELHELRKRGKEYRYLFDVFRAVEAPGARKRVEPVLKELQECLGRFQDSEVQAAAIRTFADEMVAAGKGPPVTLLAMGEVAAQLDDDQRRARVDFAGHFAAFVAATRDLHWTHA